MKEERDKYLDPPECRKLIGLVERCGTKRDYLLLLLGMNLAARASELVRLRIQDFDLEGSRVRIPTVKRLSPSQRKQKREARLAGREWRKPVLATGELPELHIEVPLASEIFPILDSYVEAERVTTWLFPSGDFHITTRTAERVFKFWARKACLSPHASLHALRHARGVDLYEKGLDLLEIKEFLRHESLSSTMVYQHLSPARRAELHRKVGSLGIGGTTTSQNR